MFGVVKAPIPPHDIIAAPLLSSPGEGPSAAKSCWSGVVRPRLVAFGGRSPYVGTTSSTEEAAMYSPAGTCVSGLPIEIALGNETE